MCKHSFTFLCILLIFSSCKSSRSIFSYKKVNSTAVNKLYTNDSIDKFNELQHKIIQKTESQTSFNNPITQHFKKFITKETLNEIRFKEWRQNIYIEFTVDKNRHVLYYKTNTSSKRLDLQIKIAFKSFEFELTKIQNFDPIYKYSIVIVQNINGTPTVKCNDRAIGYKPPVFANCTKIKDYHNLNKCNYLYITDYLYNHVDLSYTYEQDVDKNNQIHPKLIIDKEGKVAAAKVESENKQFLESYYKAIKSIPPAIHPAKFNNTVEYYGYNFPTSIINIIKNNNQFKEYTSNKITERVQSKNLMKNYIHHLHVDKNVGCTYTSH